MARDPECVANWPGCHEGGYDPSCCRFPKSCSAGRDAMQAVIPGRTTVPTGDGLAVGITPQQDDLLEQFSRAIFVERVRAHAKHGVTSMEQSGLLEHRRASILTEEAVECAKALNDHEHGEVTLQANVAGLTTVDPLDKELIQTAAMAYTWWANRRGDHLPAPETKRELPEDVHRILQLVASMQTGQEAFMPITIIEAARKALEES